MIAIINHLLMIFLAVTVTLAVQEVLNLSKQTQSPCIVFSSLGNIHGKDRFGHAVLSVCLC